QKQLPVADRKGSVGAVAIVLEDVMREQFELGLGIDDVGALELGDEIEPAVGEHRGRPDAARLGCEALVVNDLAGAGVLAMEDAAVLAGPVEVAFVVDRGGSVWAFAGAPQDVRFGDVAAAARLDRE